ncbi:MAG: DegV family protein [Dehalococcoidales bacterium]|nr:DegV family protein [Dehalococcoidales bacterium]
MTIPSSRKVAVITDSVACLTKEQTARYSIIVVPLNILYDGKAYKDWVDITPNEAYQLFLKNPDVFSTSTPSPADFLTAYRNASKQTDSILCITLSSKLSTTCNAAKLARQYAQKELPGVQIEVMDSWTATAAEGFIARSAAEAAEEGKSLSEVVKVAEEMKGKVTALVLLDTIRHVYRSGRVPRIAAQAGSLINIRPLLSVSGGVNFIGVARNRENGIELLLRKTKDRIKGKPVHMAVLHAYVPEEAEKLKQRVSAEFNCCEIWISEFSPIMGYACGTGTLGLAFYVES